MIGSLFADRYEIIAEIGSGGMAKVYKTRDTLLNRFVAIKVLRPEFADDEEFTARFTTEAQAAAALSHQNLVSLYDVGKWNGTSYIVMEYVDGITLKAYIKQQKMLNWQEAVSITTQILLGLSHAHEREIVHRDIKPQNIMITNGGLVKVMDFGIARATSAYTMKIGDTTIGSVHYFSPEQARGRHTDEKSDIYSLGIVLYEMLTGVVPFDGDSPISIAMMHLQHTPPPPKEYNVAVPLALEDIVMKAIRKDAGERYQSAHAMLNDLYAAQGNPFVSPVIGESRDVSSDTQIMRPIRSSTVAEAQPADADRGNAEDMPWVITPPEAYVPKNRKIRKEQERKRMAVKKNPVNYEEKNKKLTVWAIVAGGLLMLAVAFLVVLAMFPGIFASASYEMVPDLVGRDIDEIISAYADGNVTVTIGTRTNSTAVEKNKVITQSPLAGRSVRIPIEIVVEVSDGVKTMILPDMSGKDERSATLALMDLGLRVKAETESSSTVTEGLVIKSLPAAGATVYGNDEIVLTVSKGKNGAEIQMPSLIGLTRDDAKKLLEQYKLVLGKVSYEDSVREADVVTKQSVEKGVGIMEFSEIDVVVSNGKAPSTPTPQATKSRTISVRVPNDKGTTIIRVAADGKTIHNAPHKSTESVFTLTVTSTAPTSKIEIYYDDVLYKSETIELL
ncbi:MAG: Stk1 family PASTA domain-containing Ser/Thr kinase [Clostridiales bacterium]|jgi:serine/threonine-protein kinase|nr:Stk1 family PASTA domain-containing Ser/Thr kinase [Clostridiales bacterium]